MKASRHYLPPPQPEDPIAFQIGSLEAQIVKGQVFDYLPMDIYDGAMSRLLSFRREVGNIVASEVESDDGH